MTSPAVIVTGAAGLIGGALARALRAAGRGVIATDIRPPASVDDPFQIVDLQNADAVAELVRSREGATIVHCGAISGPMVVAGDPRAAFAINVGGALNVAEAARQAQARRLIVLSSIAVYGDQDGTGPVVESAPLRASDVYGASKAAMETMLRAYRSALGAPVTVLRVASVYGPGRETACFIRAMIEAGLRCADFPVPAAGPGRRQFVHIDDVVRALLLAIDGPRPLDFAYNVGGDSWLTEREVAELATSVLPGLALMDSGRPSEDLDGRMGPLDSSLARRDFGYSPEVSLADGVAAYAEHLRRMGPMA